MVPVWSAVWYRFALSPPIPGIRKNKGPVDKDERLAENMILSQSFSLFHNVQTFQKVLRQIIGAVTSKLGENGYRFAVS